MNTKVKAISPKTPEEDNKTGSSDSPIKTCKKDKLGLKKYALALADFIETCNTPLTIAVQGEWGTGKTSLMNMVEEELEKKVIYLKFDTWQYSQFNMQDSMVFSFLTSINDELAVRAYKKDHPDKKDEILKPEDIPDKEIKDAWKETREGLRSLVNPLRGLIKTLVDKNFGSTAAKKIDGIIKVISENSDGSSDYVSAISKLKTQFENNIQKCTEKATNKRCVIFIDDLDRLPPKNAVELLEVIKVFLDCKQCVFVLAIDYSVVANGITAKYGKDFDKNKGRNFFDKIIQLPFKMPVTQYKIENYVRDLFGTIVKSITPGEECVTERLTEGLGEGISSEEIETEKIHRREDEILGNIKDIIEKTIRTNPRSIKRLYNSFNLTLKVISQASDDTTEKTILNDEMRFYIIFYLHCIQMSQEELYNCILANILDYVDSKLKNESPDSKWIEDHFPEIEEDTIAIAEAFNKRLDSLIKSLKKEKMLDDNKIKEEIESLISYTSIASTNSNNQVQSDYYLFDGKKYKRFGKNESKRNTAWLGHDIIEKLIKIRSMKEDKIEDFRKKLKVYKDKHPRTNSLDQKDIIYFDETKAKSDGTNLIEVKENDMTLKVYVINTWGKADIEDLIHCIREEEEEIGEEFKVIFNNVEL